MQNLTAFFAAFDPLALLFIGGIIAFIVIGGFAVMKDDDGAKLVTEGKGDEPEPAPGVGPVR
jgi:hypothetical protein